MKKTSAKTRANDGIVGALMLACFAGFYYYEPMPILLLIPAVVAALMVQSAFTGFHPVYFILDQIMKD